jgi:hypothetical protein
MAENRTKSVDHRHRRAIEPQPICYQTVAYLQVNRWAAGLSQPNCKILSATKSQSNRNKISLPRSRSLCQTSTQRERRRLQQMALKPQTNKQPN